MITKVKHSKGQSTISLGVNGEEPKVIIRPRNGKHPEARA